MHITSKITMRAKPLCGWSGNPLEGVTTIHINKRNLKFEIWKRSYCTFSYMKNSPTSKKDPNSSGQSWKFNTKNYL